MQICLLCMGKTDEKKLLDLIKKYEQRLPTHYKFKRIELADIKNRKSLSQAQQLLAEEELFLAQLNPTDYVTLLDENGKSMNSVKFAKWIENHQIQATKRLVFVVGGPYGFSDGMYQRAQFKISLSSLTFTHQMVRLFITEQIYRAYTIIQGKPYHHE